MYAARRWSVRHAAGLRRLYDFCARLAPGLAPLADLAGARAEGLVAPVERLTKGALFDCRMCGRCVLSDTGMACPMNCAKQMRNGPCGGVRADGTCEVDADMRCVWLEIGDGRARSGGRPVTLRPLDRRAGGRSSWLPLVRRDAEAQIVAEPPPVSPQVDPGNPLAVACAGTDPVVTVELAPPDSADPMALVARASRFDGLVDAINITDGAGGNCHMSSAAAAAVLVAHGITPVCQVACRDRNRIAIQGDVLGAAALGVRNVLCLTGDDVSGGDQPEAKPVFDVDAVSLLRILRDMRDQARFASGRKLDQPPKLFLGATANPFAPPFAARIDNLAAKIDAGAVFIQTQFCFDVDRLAAFMAELRRRDLHRRARIIVGVGTLSSAKGLAWMAAHVPGVQVPEAFLRRIAAAADQREAGRRACLDIIDAVMSIDGVGGVHLMGHRNEAVLASIITDARLRPSPRPQ